MRHLKLFCLLALATAASGIPVTYAQTIFRARAEGSYRRGVMYRLNKMADPEAISGCDRAVLAGTVESSESNDKSEIVSFSLKLRSGEKRTINLSTSLYPQLPIEAEVGLSKLLTGGKRVRVVAFDCPSSAGVLEAEEIRAL